MTNKELQTYLKEFPDDIEVLLDRNGCIHTECAKPMIRFMGTKQKKCLVLYSPINI